MGRRFRVQLPGRKARLEAGQAVVDCIKKRLAATSTSGADGEDCRGNWLLYSFQIPLEDLIAKASQNAFAYLVVIGGGFATSGVSLAAQGGEGCDPSWLVFGIGLFVALAGGLSQQFRFGFRSKRTTDPCPRILQRGLALCPVDRRLYRRQGQRMEAIWRTHRQAQ
jgi:hypothetical protein